ETGKQSQQRGAVDGDALLVGFGELKLAALQAFVIDGQPIAVPTQDLHALAALIAEHEHAARERIVTEKRPYHFGQPVERLPHIDRRGGEPDRDARGCADHDEVSTASRARISSANLAAGIESGNRSLRPPRSSSVTADSRAPLPLLAGWTACDSCTRSGKNAGTCRMGRCASRSSITFRQA